MADTTSTPDLSATNVGDQIKAPFALVQMDHGETKTKKKMLSITLRNASGAISGKVWEESIAAWEGIKLGQAIMVTGRVKAPYYQGGANEIEIIEVAGIVGPHPVLDSMNERYPGDFSELRARYDALVAEIGHPGYQMFLDKFFESGCPWEDFSTAPAALSLHHNYLHGLFEHSCECAETALGMARIQQAHGHVNTDLVIVASLIHDSGKTHEYVWKGTPIGMNPDSLLFGHITSGPIQTMKAFTRHREELEAAGFSEEDVKHIIHIQVSHHGTQEWGSPTEPATLAAQIVHHADLASTRMRKMINILREHEPNEYGLVAGPRRGEFWKGLREDPRIEDFRPRPEAPEPAPDLERPGEPSLLDELEGFYEGPISQHLSGGGQAPKQSAPKRAPARIL